MSWTDERVERLSTLWLEGRSASQIAAELGGGVSRNAVIGKVHRLGLSGRAVPPAAEPARTRDAAPAEAPPAAPCGPAAEIAAETATEIAEAPRAAPAAAEPTFQAPAEPASAASEPAAVAAHTVDDVASIMDSAPEPITVNLPALRAARDAASRDGASRDGASRDAVSRDASRDVVIPISGRVTILELSGSMCRWPIGDPTSAEFRFCGCRASGTLPYCQEHARVAFQPVADRRRTERLIRIA